MKAVNKRLFTCMNIFSSPLPDPTPSLEPLLLTKPILRSGRLPIGQILVDIGELSPGNLVKAIAIHRREDVRFDEILLAHNMVSEGGICRGLAIQYGCDLVDLTDDAPDSRLLDKIDPAFCLRYGIIPWKRVGAMTLIATAYPGDFSKLDPLLNPKIGSTMMVIAPESQIQLILTNMRHETLVKQAETRVVPTESCRNWNRGFATRYALALLFTLASSVLVFPILTLLALTLLATISLILNTGLKVAATWAIMRSNQNSAIQFVTRRGLPALTRLPRISILVPLYQESQIAARLVQRLNRLSYPRELLDIHLIVEQNDTITQTALATANLPRWMHQITVPEAELKTKPRALNFALNFCRGSIVGVFDAEDAPEPDQLFKVARQFSECAPNVACLQGVLDFYNPRENWLSRCFTIEYATWFRIVLPGLERLSLVMPLGGTTIFFRRNALEDVGAWDAHNVTEDADLGIRLARRGYKTELIATRTEEEANCKFWPWIRQRSRWLKGYAITWIVHMRNPRQLLKELGTWRFFGMQILFLGTLSQFLLAPVLWTFWALPLGIYHPLQSILSPTVFYLLTALFFISEIVTWAVGLFALAPSKHRRLWYWVPTLHLYFPLATIAAYKGIWELVSKPFYWDKTTHGQLEPRTDDPDISLQVSLNASLTPARPLV
ncbi:MAG: glycosyltransferase family 2 protein [Paracoccaceae bacterium]